MVLILRIVYNEGFSINPEKTRVARSNARQEVTGIVVNSHMQISKEKRKQIRQQIYYIRKYGLESHLERIEENRANHLLGQINFALFVNPKDEEMKEYWFFVNSWGNPKNEIKIFNKRQKIKLSLVFAIDRQTYAKYDCGNA